MTEKLNPYQKKDYQTGINYIEGLLKIAATPQCDGDLQKALDVALRDLDENDAGELITGTTEAFRWLQNNPTELRE